MAMMLLASLLFLGTHLGVGSSTLRTRLVAMLGESGYLAAYSMVAAISLAYLIWIYEAQPHYDYFWYPSPGLYLVPKLVMPFAAILLAGALLTGNPTALGQGHVLKGSSVDDTPTRGLIRITRHPFLWAVVLWAASHLAANGDRVSVIFFGTFLLLGLAGMSFIDRKKAVSLGPDWERFARATSNIPFAAIVAGRNRLVSRELIAPVVVGLVSYVALFFAHPWIAGVRLV